MPSGIPELNLPKLGNLARSPQHGNAILSRSTHASSENPHVHFAKSKMHQTSSDSSLDAEGFFELVERKLHWKEPKGESD
jgi:hypothetical protein